MIEMASLTQVRILAAVHATSFPDEDRWDADAIATQLAQPGVFGLLDRDGGMLLARVAADEAEILTIAVSPELRRQGRGSALLSQAVALAVQSGARALFLEVSTDNAPARALYESLGFQGVGRRRRYYNDGSDAVVMRRALIGAAAANG
jgi:ribosomal-protein-alanine N-acetyltransferase